MVDGIAVPLLTLDGLIVMLDEGIEVVRLPAMDGATVALKDVVGMAVPLVGIEGLWVMTEEGGVVD